MSPSARSSRTAACSGPRASPSGCSPPRSAPPARTASEGGPWGIAVLAAYLAAADELDLGAFLDARVFGDAAADVVEPDPADVAGYATFLERYVAGLAIERAAVEAIGHQD